MRFICPDVDQKTGVRDLCKLLNYKTANVEGNLYPLIYAFTDKNGEYYYYGASQIKKYLNVIHVDYTARTLADWSTYIGLDIKTNFDATTAAAEYQILSSELLKFKTEAWITIFTDQDIRFYKPERLDSSKQITQYKIIENYKQYDSDIGYFGDTSGSIFGDIIKGDTLNPLTINTAIKNMIINSYIACADVARFTSASDASPMDFINDKGVVYLIVSKKEENGLFYYTAVRESKLSKTFTNGDVENPNLTGMGASAIIYEATLTADQDEIVIDGLDLEAHGGYDIEMSIEDGAGVGGTVRATFDDETDSYEFGLYTHEWTGNGWTGAVVNGANSDIIELVASRTTQVKMGVRPGLNGITMNTLWQIYDDTYNGVWRKEKNLIQVYKGDGATLVTNPSKMVLHSSQVGGFGAGSWIKVKALKASDATLSISVAGIPVGGSDGQVLAKASGTNYDTEWIDPPTGGSGLSQAQVLTRGLGA